MEGQLEVQAGVPVGGVLDDVCPSIRGRLMIGGLRAEQGDVSVQRACSRPVRGLTLASAGPGRAIVVGLLNFGRIAQRCHRGIQ